MDGYSTIVRLEAYQILRERCDQAPNLNFAPYPFGTLESRAWLEEAISETTIRYIAL